MRQKYRVPAQFWASDEPVQVDDIGVIGSPYTREDVFLLMTNPVRQAQTANEMHHELSEARRRLMSLGIFRSVYFAVDSSRLAGHNKIAIVAEEIPRKEYGGGVAAAAADQLALTGNLAVLNTFGRGEHYRSTFSMSPPGFAAYSAFESTFRKPLLWRPGPRQAWVARSRYMKLKRPSSRFEETTIGGSLGMERGGMGVWIGHDVQRIAVMEGATRALLEQGGWKGKTSLGYSWIFDTRDNPLIAQQGELRRLSLQLAAQSANLAPLHLKAEISMHKSHPMAGGSLTLRGHLAHVFPLNGTPIPGHRNPSLSSLDAFFLGGAHLIPGFNTRGIARSAARESLGASSYWLLSAHYLCRLPSAPDFLRAHVHASACGAGGIIGGPEEQQGFSSAFSPASLRASVGFGIVAALPGTGRLTLTYSRLLAHQPLDDTNTFIQLGFSASFD